MTRKNVKKLSGRPQVPNVVKDGKMAVIVSPSSAVSLTGASSSKSPPKPPKRNKGKDYGRGHAPFATDRTIGSLLAVDRLKNRGAHSGAIAKYEKSLSDPFQFAPPSIVYDCILPKSRMPLWKRGEMSFNPTGAGNTWLILWSIPSTNPNTAAGVDIGVLNYTSLTGNAFAAVSPTYSAIPAANITTYNSLANSSRCISGGFNVSIKFASTAIPPTIYAGNVADSPLNFFNGYGPDKLTSKSSARLIDTSAARCGAYSNWRPIDPVQFTFTSMAYSTAANTRDCVQWMAISAQTGQTYNITYEVIYHMEQQSGMDVGLEDDVAMSGPDVLNGDPADVAMAARHVPTFPVGDIEDIASTLMQSFSGAAARNIPSLSMEGGLVPVGAPTPAVSAPIGTSTSAPPKPTTALVATKEKWTKIEVDQPD